MEIRKFKMFDVAFITIEVFNRFIVLYRDVKYNDKNGYFNKLYSLNKRFKLGSWNIIVDKAVYRCSYQEISMKGENRLHLDIRGDPTVIIKWFDSKSER